MSEHSWQNISDEVPWVFIPWSNDNATKVYFWIKRLASSKEVDEALAKECEEAIGKAFSDLKLRYDTDKYGSLKMANLRLFSGSDGVAMPETCFIEPSDKLKRITKPLLRPIID